MRMVVPTVVIAALAVLTLKLYSVDSTMAFVLGGIGFSGVIMWIAEG